MASFDEKAFEKKLLALKDSQESISTLSDWCLQNRTHHKKIVNSWLHVLKRVKVDNRLTLFYLANDVIQYSKRKNYDFVESWGTALQKATTMVRDEKVIHRILRIFNIWGDRNVYDDAFLTDLRGLLTATKGVSSKSSSQKNEPEPEPEPAPAQTAASFEASNLFLKINNCKQLEDDTDLKLKLVNECKLKISELDSFRKSLKDRKHADDMVADVEDVISSMEAYKKALHVEMRERKAVIELLHLAEKFYENERGEAKIVFNAYRNFGSRVKTLKRKLDDLIPSLPSPVPSPDVNAPSPSPDSDIDLPNDEDLSGIVECLDDLPGYGDECQSPKSSCVDEEEEEEDLMSVISYVSNDDDFDYVHGWCEVSCLPGTVRRKSLPLPPPIFSDSELSGCEGGFSPIKSCGLPGMKSKCPSVQNNYPHEQICNSISLVKCNEKSSETSLYSVISVQPDVRVSETNFLNVNVPRGTLNSVVDITRPVEDISGNVAQSEPDSTDNRKDKPDSDELNESFCVTDLSHSSMDIDIYMDLEPVQVVVPKLNVNSTSLPVTRTEISDVGGSPDSTQKLCDVESVLEKSRKISGAKRDDIVSVVTSSNRRVLPVRKRKKRIIRLEDLEEGEILPSDEEEEGELASGDELSDVSDSSNTLLRGDNLSRNSSPLVDHKR